MPKEAQPGHPDIDPAGRPSIARTPGLDFIPMRIGDATRLRRLPVTGELMIWRFRAEWTATAGSVGLQDLTRKEQKRATRGASYALGKRHLVSRAFLRGVLSVMLDCAPADVELAERHDGTTRLLAPCPDPAIVIRVVYAGVWVLLGISPAALAISAAVPPVQPGARAAGANAPIRFDAIRDPTHRDGDARPTGVAPTDTRSAQPSGQEPAQAGTALAETAERDRAQVVELPMPGLIRASVATHAPLSTVWAFGWHA